MRFSVRQLLVAVAFVCLLTAYGVQCVKYSSLLERYDSLETRFKYTRGLVEQVTHISVEDQARGPDSVILHLPAGWPGMLKDEWEGVPTGSVPPAAISRLPKALGR